MSAPNPLEDEPANIFTALMEAIGISDFGFTTSEAIAFFSRCKITNLIFFLQTK